MLKTLNTLTSLVANEGVTGAVTRSLQAMERSFEARITGVRNDFARMLDERMSRAQYEAQTERQKVQEAISRAETAVSRVDNMLDVVTKLRMQASDSARVAEGAGRGMADRLEAVLTRMGELTARVTELKDSWVAELRAIVGRLDKLESNSERSNDHIAARYEQQLDTIFERLDKLEAKDLASRDENHALNATLNAFGRRLVALEDRATNPDSTVVTAGREVGDRIEALEMQAWEVRNAFGRRLAALESQVAGHHQRLFAVEGNRR